MDDAAMTASIVDAFDGVDVVETEGNRFFFADPGDLPPDRRFPFATLVTSDAYDQFSDLDRPGVYRLNVGVSPRTFRALFGPAPAEAGGASDDPASDYDFTALDRLMPHPVYGRMFWVCVLNPSAATLQTARPLLAEAYDLATRRDVRRRGRTSPEGR